jgi:drug/metabolite transporter (DMT)-like permease
VLAAALCHATWNLVAKRAGGGSAFMLISALQVAVLWAPLAAWVGWQAVGTFNLMQWGVLAASAVVTGACGFLRPTL